MKVKDVMTRNVAYINPASTVVEAAQLMQKHNVGSVPVCDENGIIGIVTDRDIIVRNIAHGKDPHQTPVKDVMTSEVTSVDPETEIRDVFGIMSEKKIRRIPVVENNQLVGIVALGDVATSAKQDVEISSTLADISSPSRPEMM
ncbi:MAG: CBS domain-containing protein [Clostridiaceae bacterium]|jgi:CBS domain-containing protein|nr:CBS domain-containing protein [Clostridiaceae bacterium]